MAEIVKDAFSNNERYHLWKQNLMKAAAKYTWENEAQKLKEICTDLK